MKHLPSKSMKFRALVIGLLALLPSHVWACAVCMGADSRTGEAVNGAIFVMLGLIGTMLAAFAAFAVYLMNRG